MEQWQHQNIVVKHFAKPPLTLPTHKPARSGDTPLSGSYDFVPHKVDHYSHLCQGKTNGSTTPDHPQGCHISPRLTRLYASGTDSFP